MRNWFTSTEERWLVALLMIASLALHIVRLDQPRQVIFDEVHFGKFVTAYCCTHQRFFDIHPPHAKLLIASVVAATSYKGDFSFDHIGQPYGDVPVFAFRLMPALVGALLPLLIYFLLRQVKVSMWLAWLGAVAVLVDNSLVLQSRIIALDGILLASTIGALMAYLASLTAVGKKKWLLLVLVGALSGLCAGTKFTGLATLLLIGLFMIYRMGTSFTKKVWMAVTLEAIVVLLAAMTVYVGGWYIHFSLLTQPGPGDAWQVPTGTFFVDLVDLHRKMLSANYNLSATHPYSSAWWTWPLMMRSVFYWQSGQAAIYFLGNPMVWWGSFILFAGFIGTILWRYFHGAPARVSVAGWMFLTGYVVTFVPLMRVPRALFLYHYLTPLLFSLLAGMVWLDELLIGEERKRQVAWGMAAAVILVSIFFSPLTFGFATDPAWRTLLYWLPGWR